MDDNELQSLHTFKPNPKGIVTAEALFEKKIKEHLTKNGNLSISDEQLATAMEDGYWEGVTIHFKAFLSWSN